VLTNNPKFLAHQPDAVVFLTNFSFTFGNNTPYYGTRIYGYFIAPADGLYRFYIRSDDASQLWMNTNSVNSTDPAGKVMIVEEPACCEAYSAHVSPNIPMQRGQYYYMESLQEQGEVIEYVQVAFREASDPTDPPSQPSATIVGAEVMPSLYMARPIVVPTTRPQVQIAMVDADTVKLTWAAGTPPVGVDYTDDLNPTNWQPSGAAVVTEPDGSFSATITGVSGQPPRFYRLSTL
jgi:hypothetical protein